MHYLPFLQQEQELQVKITDLKNTCNYIRQICNIQRSAIFMPKHALIYELQNKTLEYFFLKQSKGTNNLFGAYIIL